MRGNAGQCSHRAGGSSPALAKQRYFSKERVEIFESLKVWDCHCEYGISCQDHNDSQQVPLWGIGTMNGGWKTPLKPRNRFNIVRHFNPYIYFAGNSFNQWRTKRTLRLIIRT
jgi:hypothetical protein